MDYAYSWGFGLASSKVFQTKDQKTACTCYGAFSCRLSFLLQWWCQVKCELSSRYLISGVDVNGFFTQSELFEIAIALANLSNFSAKLKKVQLQMGTHLSIILAVADPGFPVGGGGRGPRRRGCGLPRRLRFENFVCQNKRIGTLRGAHAGRAP